MYTLLLLFIETLLHVSTHTAPSSGRTLVTCSKLFASSNVVALVTKRKIYHMWVLRHNLQLLEQYLAVIYVLKVNF